MKLKITPLAILVTFFLLSFTGPQALAGSKKVTIGVSQSDAEIWVNGKLVAKGSTEIKVEKDACANISIRKVGFLEEQLEICNNKTTIWEKSKYFELKPDDSYDASIQTDIANVDIELIVNTMDKDTAWKLINQIVLNYIDVIEMTDKDTGYLRTAWSLKAFKQNTIRTRIIVKESSSNPLVFKAKLISEYSGAALTSVKADELYKEWDRVLRSYSDVISEFQARVK
ncbi:MAG: hypothetical protein R2786_02980 [Flavobacteriaceae bacterium]